MLKVIKSIDYNIMAYQGSTFIGYISNEIEDLEFRAQVAEQRAENVYYYWNDMTIEINSKGDIIDRPKDFLDQEMKALSKLFREQLRIRNENTDRTRNS